MANQSNSSTHISDIPDELLALIFRSLKDYGDRASCTLVCPTWSRVEAQSRQRLSLINDDDPNLELALPALFSRFQSVTRLVIKSLKHVNGSLDSEALTDISLMCPNLETLKLFDNKEYRSLHKGLAAIGTNTRLKKFSCRNCWFGVEGLNALLSHSSTLEIISIKNLPCIECSTELVYPGAAESSLKSISVKDIMNTSKAPKIFAPLICGSKNLATLKLFQCSGDWDQVLSKMVAHRENVSLCEVYLDTVRVSDVGLSAFRKYSKLEMVHIVNIPECTNSGIEAVVKHCKSLRKIHIDNWRTQRKIGTDECEAEPESEEDDILVAFGKHNAKLQVVKY